MNPLIDKARTWLKVLRDGREGPPGPADLQVLERLVREARAAIETAFPSLTQVKRLTYEEAIGWFTRERPADARIAKGAIFRTRAEGAGWVVTQVYLDASLSLVLRPDGAPWGRRLDVAELDEELESLFDGEDLVVVE